MTTPLGERRRVTTATGLSAPEGMDLRQFDFWFANTFGGGSGHHQQVQAHFSAYIRACESLPPPPNVPQNSANLPLNVTGEAGPCSCWRCQGVRAFAVARGSLRQRVPAHSLAHLRAVIEEVNLQGGTHLHVRRDANTAVLGKVPGCDAGAGGGPDGAPCPFVFPGAAEEDLHPMPSQTQPGGGAAGAVAAGPRPPNTPGSLSGRRVCEKCKWISSPNPQGHFCEVCGRVWHSQIVRNRAAALGKKNNLQRARNKEVRNKFLEGLVICLQYRYTFRGRNPRMAPLFESQWLNNLGNPTWKAWNEQAEAADTFYAVVGLNPTPSQLLDLLGVRALSSDCLDSISLVECPGSYRRQRFGDLGEANALLTRVLTEAARVDDQERCFDAFCSTELDPSHTANDKILNVELVLRTTAFNATNDNFMKKINLAALITMHNRWDEEIDRGVYDFISQQEQSNFHRIFRSSRGRNFGSFHSVDTSAKGLLVSLKIEKDRCRLLQEQGHTDWRQVDFEKALAEALESEGGIASTLAPGTLADGVTATIPQLQTLHFLLSQEGLPSGTLGHLWSRDPLRRSAPAAAAVPGWAAPAPAALRAPRHTAAPPLWWSPLFGGLARGGAPPGHSPAAGGAARGAGGGGTFWGGLLADGRGLGKKLPLLLLVLRARCPPGGPKGATPAAAWGGAGQEEAPGCRSKATLIICSKKRIQEFFESYTKLLPDQSLKMIVHDDQRFEKMKIDSCSDEDFLPREYAEADVVFLDAASLVDNAYHTGSSQAGPAPIPATAEGAQTEEEEQSSQGRRDDPHHEKGEEAGVERPGQAAVPEVSSMSLEVVDVEGKVARGEAGGKEKGDPGGNGNVSSPVLEGVEATVKAKEDSGKQPSYHGSGGGGSSDNGSCNTSGDGSGDVSGNGNGNGNGNGDGNGNGNASGNGNGNASGDGDSDSGDGDSGDGDASGDGDGDSGDASGNASGNASGDGSGNASDDSRGGVPFPPHRLSPVRWWRVVLYDCHWLGARTSSAALAAADFQAARRWGVTSQPLEFGLQGLGWQLQWAGFPLRLEEAEGSNNGNWQELIEVCRASLQNQGSLICAKVPELLCFLRRVLLLRSPEQQIMCSGLQNPQNLGSLIPKVVVKRIKVPAAALGPEHGAFLLLRRAVDDRRRELEREVGVQQSMQLQQSLMDLKALLLYGSAVGAVPCPSNANEIGQDLQFSQDDSVETECCICFQKLKDKAVLPCKHEFCPACVKSLTAPCCPMCRAAFRPPDVSEVRAPRPHLFRNIRGTLPTAPAPAPAVDPLRVAGEEEEELPRWNRVKVELLLQELDQLSSFLPISVLVLVLFSKSKECVEACLNKWKLRQLAWNRTTDDIQCLCFEKDSSNILGILFSEKQLPTLVYLLDPIDVSDALIRGEAARKIKRNLGVISFFSHFDDEDAEESYLKQFPWCCKSLEEYINDDTSLPLSQKASIDDQLVEAECEVVDDD